MKYWIRPHTDGVHFKFFSPSGEEIEGMVSGTILALWRGGSETDEVVFARNMDRIKDAALRKHSISGSAVLSSSDF